MMKPATSSIRMALRVAIEIGRQRHHFWILDRHMNVVPAANFGAWVEWAWEDPEHRYRVAHTRIDDTVSISTVFYGFSFDPANDGIPATFDTAILHGPRDAKVSRHRTYVEALAFHRATAATMVKRHAS